MANPIVQRRLGRAVKQIRISRGLTQEEVAAASGLHATYISDIERGARNPSWDVMARLATGIGVTVADIGARFDAEQEQAEQEQAAPDQSDAD